MQLNKLETIYNWINNLGPNIKTIIIIALTVVVFGICFDNYTKLILQDFTEQVKEDKQMAEKKAAPEQKEMQGQENKAALKTDKPATKEELKKLIREKSFVDIGKQYNVTDNAIRKWCASYGLPTRKKDIKKYTDEDWALL